MRSLRAWLLRLTGMLGGSRADVDFAAELDAHLAMHVDDNVRAGMMPDEARRQALLKLGGVAQTQERYRERRGLPLVDELGRDLRYAGRTLRRNPGYSVTAALTLALGIGANAAIFSIVYAVLLRPLPFADAGRLVMVFATDARGGDRHDVASYPDYIDWSRASGFERTGAFAGGSVTVAGHGPAQFVRGLRVSASLFGTLGAQPVLGRGFTSREEEPGAGRAVVLSDGFWKQEFGGAAGVLGSTLRINDVEHTIVGIMPAGFQVSPGSPEQLYVPLTIDPIRNHGFLRVIGRLRPGVGLKEARAELQVIAERLGRTYPKTNATVGVNPMPLADAMSINVRASLFLLVAVVVLVLLIACSNVAGLMLARGAARRHELAVRAALGAGRGRLVRQLLAESMLLALAGGIVGLVIGAWTAHGLGALLATEFNAIPRIETVRTDAAVVVFTMGLSLLTGLAFGLAPALASASTRSGDALHDAGRTVTGGHAPRVRRGLVILETALALVLLGAGAVLLKALLMMRATPPGFHAEQVLAADLWLPQPRFARLADRARYYDEVLSRLQATAGIRDAGFVADLPLNGGSDGLGFHIVGRPDPTPDRTFTARFNIATPGYFRAMSIPVKSGRPFTADDREASPGVVVINETAARSFWPGQSPLGRQIELPLENEQPEEHERGAGAPSRRTTTLTVVGVVGDVRQTGLAVPPRPEIFLDAMQATPPWPWSVLVVRTSGDPETLQQLVRTASQEADPNVPIVRVNTMDDILARSLAEPRVYAIVVGVFAALALALASIGLYGVISYGVSQRTHEIGVRVALGAKPGAIVGMVLREGVRLAVSGALPGFVGAIAATRILARVAPGIDSTDPLVLAAVSVLLLVVAATASYAPARRAARVDPAIALRAE